LDYLPTDDYKTLGHGANWGNREGTPSSQVTLFFEKADGSVVEASCRLRSARNAGISITGSVPSDLTSLLRTKKKFFSAYIPGISGVPNKEERKSKKVILKACSFGDSNVILRNALLLLKDSDPRNITLIENWIGRIIGPISINVEHNNDSDLYVRCAINMAGSAKPIELAGTGYLQLIQIFCYVLLFEPGVLLIDEPDIHLHPHVQELLVKVLAEVAKERGIRILLTTHSPFIVRGAPQGTNVCWLQDGKIESDNRQLVEAALGWGAFGKRVIIVSEDSNTALLRKLVSQWPEIDRAVAFYPGTGYKSVPTALQAKELSETLGGKFKVLVHRDRDSLTDDEVISLGRKYESEGADFWCPAESDIEAYFCGQDFLVRFIRCTHEEAEGYLASAMASALGQVREQFNGQRVAHNQELYKAGGSPTNDEVWNQLQLKPLKGAKGKSVFKQLKNKVPKNAFDEAKILTSDLGGLLGNDLKLKIESLLVA
jgi:energy-coupling factor transporter ATP-binding protein EcfA2